MKKGQGISINVIIIAAIALLVLVILAVLVLRGGSKLNDGTESCMANYGGTCKDPYDCEVGSEVGEETECDAKGEVCCKVIPDI